MIELMVFVYMIMAPCIRFLYVKVVQINVYARAGFGVYGYCL